jgi:HEAT repeat protein
MTKKRVVWGVILAGLLVGLAVLIRDLTDPVARLARKLKGKTGALAAMELAEMGARAEPAVPRLINALQNHDEDLRLNAALALGKIGKGSVASLTPLLSSKDSNVRYYALAALAWIGKDANSAFDTVLERLHDEIPDVRAKAVHTLSLIAITPEAAAITLIPCLGDPDYDVQHEAVEALVKVGQSAAPFLKAAVNTGEESFRRRVREVLSEVNGSPATSG